MKYRHMNTHTHTLISIEKKKEKRKTFTLRQFTTHFGLEAKTITLPHTFPAQQDVCCLTATMLLLLPFIVVIQMKIIVLNVIIMETVLELKIWRNYKSKYKQKKKKPKELPPPSASVWATKSFLSQRNVGCSIEPLSSQKRKKNSCWVS